MLSQEQKDKWVAALRSGNFKQGQYRLRCNDKYCCLGVFAEINPTLFEKELCYDGCTYSYNGSAGYLKSTDDNEMILCMLDQNRLSLMNDNQKDFKTIADWIEQNLDVSSQNIQGEAL